MKNLRLTLLAASLAAALNASAAFSSINFVQWDAPGAFTTPSPELGGSALTSLPTEDFGAADAGSTILTLGTATISGLTDTLSPYSLTDFLVFSGPNPPDPGTTPPNRFRFDLRSLGEVLNTSGGELTSIYYYGEGTLWGLAGQFAPTTANLGASVVVQSGMPTPAFQGVLSANLSLVPEARTVLAGAVLLLPFGMSTLRVLRRKPTA